MTDITAVAPDLAEAFRRDGAVCVRRAFAPELVEAVAAGIDADLATPSPRAKIASRDGDGRFFEDFCTWQHIPQFERFIRESPAPAIAGELMGSPRVRLFHDHVLAKQRGPGQPPPWHQDQPYYNVDGTMTCSMWMPVDPMSRDSSLEFVAGSHLGPSLMPRTFMDNEGRGFPEGSLADLPDVDSHRGDHTILGWELEPGDAVFFHMLTLHAAGGSATRRRAFSVRFLGDDVTHAPRAWVTSPEFPGLADELPAGAPMEHPLFPIVWER